MGVLVSVDTVREAELVALGYALRVGTHHFEVHYRGQLLRCVGHSKDFPGTPYAYFEWALRVCWDHHERS